MKCLMLLTGAGPMVVLTTCDSPTSPPLLSKLAAKGIEKFIAYEIPIEVAEKRYGTHFAAVAHDIHETDQLRVLDFNGQRVYGLFKFEELGPPVRYESPNSLIELHP
ncbi:MAG: hypothetical protein U1E66_09320 [Rhodospirillales bacterium]